MKTLLQTFSALMISAGLMTACSPSNTQQNATSEPSTPTIVEVKKVAITAIVEHPALNAVHQGVVDELAEHYRFVFISGIEKLSAEQRSEARRLTWLIDILYDYRVKLCATFHVPLEEIYTEGDFAEEFTRTVSRMQEMQSDDYLQRSHLTLENQSENESSIFQPA